ncbi:hypothetical protein SAMN05421493_10795 [Pseudobutyrivibrio sp. 49]|uniref:hypothetical protein n=1 Tax=Pseudobutyrivibrio sp. 49 TaxID=1855344 RepID=UPI0008900A2A|nr:hypothetical protein [Pseudobutyrivibrio sp. 49]SDI06526.1 hypothetical protein SAMN05421493_10795 [Pseudobutyrivibrio sp. 49]
MNKEELYKSMDGIDDEVLLKYYKYKPAKKIIYFRKAAVIAASICLVVVAGSVIKIMNNTSDDIAIESAMPETAAETYTAESSSEEKGEDSDALLESAAPARSFTITACASENDKTLLESGKTIPLKLGDSYTTYGFSGTDNNGIGFQFYLPKLIVEGDNIANITYSVDKYEMTVYNYNYGVDGKVDKKSGTSEFGKQYTVAYEDQLDKYFQIVVRGDVDSDEKIYHDIFEPDTIQDKLAAINQILDGVKVNCTVTYKDGTTEEADIALSAEYHTYDELDDVFWDSDKTGIYKDGTIIMTFELK